MKNKVSFLPFYSWSTCCFVLLTGIDKLPEDILSITKYCVQHIIEIKIITVNEKFNKTTDNILDALSFQISKSARSV